MASQSIETRNNSNELTRIVQEILDNKHNLEQVGGDRNEWDEALRVEIPDYSFFNLTDFNYGKCHTYEIYLPAGIFKEPGSLQEERQLIQHLGGRRFGFLLKLSSVAPYFLLQLLSRTVDPSGQVSEEFTKTSTVEQRKMAEKLSRFAKSHAFRPIPLEFLTHRIPGIELELAKPGTVNVYNCLFEDQDNFIMPKFVKLEEV